MPSKRAAGGASGASAVIETLFVSFFALAINLATGVLTARSLGPVGRAEQAAILLGVQLFPSLTALGVPLAVQYLIRSRPESERQLVAAAVWLCLASSVAGAILGCFILPLLLAKYSAATIAAARLVMVVAPLSSLHVLLVAVLQARHRFREANFLRYANPLTTLGALLLLIALHRMNPIASAAAYVVPVFWALPWLWWRTRPQPATRLTREFPAALLGYGMRSYVGSILGNFAAQIDQILVVGLLAPKLMGIYVVALGAAKAGDLFSSSIATVLFPKASGLDRRAIFEMTGRAARVISALLAASTAFLVVAMPLLLPLVYGRAYAAAVPVASLIVVSIALNGVIYVLSQGYMASGKPGLLAITQTVGLATVVPALAFAIPRFGLIGAASALLLSSLVRLAIALGGYPAILALPVPSLVVRRDDIAYVRGVLQRKRGAMRGV